MNSKKIFHVVETFRLLRALAAWGAKTGRRRYETHNSKAAFLSGLPVRATIILAYTIAGGFAAFSGVLQASSLANAQPAAGSGLVLTIIAGVIIGGTSLLGGRGSIVGTLLGSVLLGILSNAFILLRLNPEIQVVSLGVVIVFAALFDQWRMRRSGS
jgi:ribose/xylose/arabinose/galactoside ABC-type transport system permease subunit